MAAASLLAACHRHGVRVRVAGERLIVRPKSALPSSLRAELIAEMPDVVALLRRAPELGRAPHVERDPSALFGWVAGDGSCYACGGDVFWKLRVADELVCAICHPPGPPPERIEWRRGRVRG